MVRDDNFFTGVSDGIITVWRVQVQCIKHLNISTTIARPLFNRGMLNNGQATIQQRNVIIPSLLQSVFLIILAHCAFFLFPPFIQNFVSLNLLPIKGRGRADFCHRLFSFFKLRICLGFILQISPQNQVFIFFFSTNITISITFQITFTSQKMVIQF